MISALCRFKIIKIVRVYLRRFCYVLYEWETVGWFLCKAERAKKKIHGGFFFSLPQWNRDESNRSCLYVMMHSGKQQFSKNRQHSFNSPNQCESFSVEQIKWQRNTIHYHMRTIYIYIYINIVYKCRIPQRKLFDKAIRLAIECACVSILINTNSINNQNKFTNLRLMPSPNFAAAQSLYALIMPCWCV